MASNFLLPLGTTLLLLLLSLSPTSNAGPEPVDLPPVLDLEGNPLEVDSEYYILPMGAGFRGGLTTSPMPGQFMCPLYVVESPIETNLGSPVKFIPRHSSQKQILFHSDVQIDSGFSAYCRNDGIWRVSLSPIRRRLEIVATGVDVPRTWFTIGKVAHDAPFYTIDYCPPHGGICRKLGIFNDFQGLIKFLGVSINDDDILQVGFLKKAGAKTSATLQSY